MPKRVILIILDGVGCGEMPDAAQFDSLGANTLGHVAQACPQGLNLPNLGDMGLGNIIDLRGVPRVGRPTGAFGKMAEMGPAKDTTLGHWEIAGVLVDQPFPVFPEGFPAELLKAFCDKAEVPGVLGNKPASGTEIIKELGAEHMATRKPIVYTSADSVFQIACHEEIYPIEQLYRQCEIARELCDGPWRVGRVIARPFLGKPGKFERTPRRHDYSVEPLGTTILDAVSQAGLVVDGVGKISDIFAGRGITHSTPTTSNRHGMEVILQRLKAVDRDGLIFANLVDTDMVYGHRNDTPGFRKALEEIDAWIPALLHNLSPDDLLIITADHGIDPTDKSSDHTREYVPLLVQGALVRAGVNLGTRDTFADVAATIDHWFGFGTITHGTSFLDAILEPTGPPVPTAAG